MGLYSFLLTISTREISLGDFLGREHNYFESVLEAANPPWSTTSFVVALGITTGTEIREVMAFCQADTSALW